MFLAEDLRKFDCLNDDVDKFGRSCTLEMRDWIWTNWISFVTLAVPFIQEVVHPMKLHNVHGRPG